MNGYLTPATDFSYFDPFAVPVAIYPKTLHTMNYAALFPMTATVNGTKYYKTFHFLPNLIYSYPGLGNNVRIFSNN